MEISSTKTCRKICTVIFDVMIEVLAGDAGSNTDVEVLRVVVLDRVHLRQVETDAAVQSRDSGLQSGSGSVWNDRNIFGIAKFANLERKEKIVWKVVEENLFLLRQSLLGLFCSFHTFVNN